MHYFARLGGTVSPWCWPCLADGVSGLPATVSDRIVSMDPSAQLLGSLAAASTVSSFLGRYVRCLAVAGRDDRTSVNETGHFVLMREHREAHANTKPPVVVPCGHRGLGQGVRAVPRGTMQKEDYRLRFRSRIFVPRSMAFAIASACDARSSGPTRT